MSSYKDIITKDIIKHIAKDISKYILKIDVSEDIELIDKEFSRVEKREADILFKSSDKIIHIEIQNNNHPMMDRRMLRYFSDIYFDFGVEYEILQYVIYIGKEKCSMRSKVMQSGIDYSYNLVDIKDIPCENFLNSSNPSAIALSILCDFRDRDKQEVVNLILRKLRDNCIDDIEFRSHFKMVEILSANRNLSQEIKRGEDMLRVDIEKLPSYEIGFERGIEKGTKRGIERGIEIERLKSAITAVKEFNLPIEDVANKFSISIKILKNELKKRENIG